MADVPSKVYNFDDMHISVELPQKPQSRTVNAPSRMPAPPPESEFGDTPDFDDPLFALTTATSPPKKNFKLDSKDKRGIYQLYIMNIAGENGPKVATVPSAALNSRNVMVDFSDGMAHEFRTAPHTIEFQEVAAAHIQPTIGMGKYIDERDQATKLVTIAGTTGFRPNIGLDGGGNSNPIVDAIRGFDGIDILNTGGGLAGRQETVIVDHVSDSSNPFKAVSNTVADLLPQGPLEIGPFSLDNNDERGLPRGEITGFDEMLSLKNLIRIYFDLKEERLETGVWPGHYRMVWADMYSHEFWIVVPMALQINRNASKPFQFDYRIQLRTIVPLVGTLTKMFATKNSKSSNLFSKARNIIRQTREVFLDAKNIVDATSNRTRREVLGTVHESRQTYNVLANVLNDPGGFFFGSLNQLGKDIATSIDTFTDITGGDTKRDRYSSNDGSSANSPETRNLNDNFNNLSVYDDAYAAAVDSKSAVGSLLSAEDAFDSELTQALNNIIRSTDTLRSGLASLELQSGISLDDIQFIRAEFGLSRDYDSTGAPVQLSSNYGYVLDHRNLYDPKALGEVTVQYGEDIYDIAQRIFGDRLEYKILALINKLRHPYIADVPSQGVLAPGDLIKYPAEAGFNGRNNVSYDGSLQADVERRYGTDINVSFDDGLIELQVDSGDFKKVHARANLRQAMNLKHSVAIGSLPAHPGFGLPIRQGLKLTPAVSAGLDLAMKTMYLTDGRVESVKAVDFRAVGDLLLMQTELKAVGSDESVVQRFGVR